MERPPATLAGMARSRDRVAPRSPDLGEIGAVDEDRDVAQAAHELADAADMVEMSVRADDALELVDAAADPSQGTLEHEARAKHARIDEREPFLGDEERIGAERPDLVDAGDDLHARAWPRSSAQPAAPSPVRSRRYES
jgi:hypothetical protein